LLDYFLEESSAEDVEELTRECDLSLKSVSVMILTYHEVLMVYGLLERG